jgi:4-aminobutyrate aminotransferase-like enzyme
MIFCCLTLHAPKGIHGNPEPIAIENVHMSPFFTKIPVSIDKGKGVCVWDEEENRYLALTAVRVTDKCLARRVFIGQTQGNGIRVFPALNIERGQLMDGLATLQQAIEIAAH